MSEKDPSNKKDSSNEDDDFGLPKVKFTPIGPEKRASAEVPSTPVISEGRVKNTERDSESTGKAKGNGFLLLLLLFILVLGLGSLYFFGFFESNKTEISSVTTVRTPAKSVPTTPEVVETDGNTDLIPEVETSENILSEITARTGSPRYFVVVASFIDDDLAKDYSSELNKSGNPTFLIHPYGDISYFRLAIAQYDNVKKALEVMDNQQGNFEENLWVLKY